MNHLERALDNQNQAWKYILLFLIGLLLIAFIGALPQLAILMHIQQKYNAVILNINDLVNYGFDLNAILTLNIFPFIIGLLVLFALIKTLHGRSYTEVINGTKKIRWNHFFFAFLLWTSLIALYYLVKYMIAPQNFIFQFQAEKFIVLLVVTLLLIPFQTIYEEVMFRGYLMQGFAVWTNNRWLPIIFTALIFGLLHVLNPEIEEYGFWIVMPQYIIFGLLFGLTTVLDDGIETAMGAHTAHNIFLCLILTSEGSALQTYALFQEINIKMSVIDIFDPLAIGTIFLIVLYFKYKWNFSVLNKKVKH
ncbi:MAG TPA: type II CAAX endopeptidase family protein [Bacteroidales bacterium]|nr:type II CAAX endopeptidase family protein [Bacteroidales bacterium]HON21027.1 type II CAAX endopeptidase family protein [Bacteroidales bacterium]HOR81746.1 type II CAAX endopeptidase family protein [Bacteroidales bacterium]HPJ91187.1 type II CAAX endopeptidase family protein [Bacteroidales bacterium]HQB19237.1 type II CAAX endopeptidase family protein [Bacteroidales bacterium]